MNFYFLHIKETFSKSLTMNIEQMLVNSMQISVKPSKFHLLIDELSAHLKIFEHFAWSLNCYLDEFIFERINFNQFRGGLAP